jgi:hypothetical protein
VSEEAASGNTKRWQFLDTRELPDGSEVVYHWRMDVAERYCVDSGRVVSPIPGDRCLSHGARGVMCTTAERMPECQHTRLSPIHPYPHCSECRQDGEDVTAEVAAWLASS